MVGSSAASGTGPNAGAAAANAGGALNLNTGGNGVGNGNGIGQGGIDDSCAADVSTGKLVPLDMYIMLDVSSSMLDLTATNVSKWDAVKSALETFVKDSASAGLGVGLQYFPLAKPTAPTSCTSDAACGNSGPCFLSFCWAYPTAGGLLPCSTNADCGNQFGPCTALATCANDDTILCRPTGSDCGTDPQTNKALGACSKLPTSTCEHTASCDIPTYATPDQPIATLPGAAAALTASIDAKMPNGQTPTEPALAGAIQQASTWAKAHPDHRVITVLATDGLPTECTAANVANPVVPVAAIAAAGLAATPSIETFVIGVFGPDDVTSGAPGNLDEIATAGGNMQAFIVDTTKDVTTQFLAALDAIRGGKLDCAFQIPQPGAGETLAYEKVNVQVKTAAGTSKLFYVADPKLCDPTTGGWYYDQDPTMGAVPTQIIACPTSCTSFQAAKDASVEIALGCQTIIK
jgi:hypothetical protein